MKNQLLLQSRIIKKEADKILKESDLLNILKIYGEVKFVGSYALDVMLRPDLDVLVFSSKHDFSKLKETLKQIVIKNYFQQICFANWVDFRKQDTLNGYYIQPQIKIGNNNWKLDIWLLTRDQYKPQTERFAKLLKFEKKSEFKKLSILSLKNEFRKGSKYIKPIDGKLIYEAVLEKGVQNKPDFMKYLKSKNIKLEVI